MERSAAAVADARVNLADDDVRLVKVALARWRPSPTDVVVADPARRGLGIEGVTAVEATGAGPSEGVRAAGPRYVLRRRPWVRVRPNPAAPGVPAF